MECETSMFGRLGVKYEKEEVFDRCADMYVHCFVGRYTDRYCVEGGC